MLPTICFLIDGGTKLKNLAEIGIIPKHRLYGGYELEKRGQSIIRNRGHELKEDICITTVPLKSIIEIPIRKQKILININSNHQLKNSNYKKMGIQLAFNLFNHIICISNTQVIPLINFGINTSKIHVIPLGINDDVIKIALKRKKQGNYYLSAGGDAGRIFDFNVGGVTIKTIQGNTTMSYLAYCKELVNSRGLVLKIKQNKNSSDCSGSITVLEALCAKKPVFINPQPWLIDYPNPNIHIYKNDKELEKLLKKNIKWKKCDISYLKMDRYLKELKDVILNK